jgi:hypothetical protein
MGLARVDAALAQLVEHIIRNNEVTDLQRRDLLISLDSVLQKSAI